MSKDSAIAWLFICTLMIVAVWIRIHGVEPIPAGMFTETDAYLYYWQAQIISEQGQLPARDMHRWLPLGRDLGQTLNLYSYALAYAHKAVAWAFPNITLYHVTLYMPVVCFCIGLGALCLFLYYTYGLLFSCTVGVLLATLPGSIERSAAGFGDRDAWCLMLGIFAVITYLASLQVQRPRIRHLWTLASGVTVFLGGISWEGFGVFLILILVVELWRFLTSETEEGLGRYLLWVLSFVPTLYLASEAYRSGYGFAKHLFAYVLAPPLVLLGMRLLRYLLLSKVSLLRPHARTLALGLTLGGLTLALGYVLIQQETFADTTVPLSQNAVMQAMTELRAPHFGYWGFRYGTVFLFGSLGFVLIPFHLWKKQGALLSIPLVLFTLFSFFRQIGDKLWGEPAGNAFFGIAVAGCAIALLLIAWRRKAKGINEFVGVAFLAWFLMWVALSRDAKRYDFFIGVALAFGTATWIQFITDALSEKLWHASAVTDKERGDFPFTVLKTGVSLILLASLLFLPINHAHTYRAIYAATLMRKATPSLKVAMAMFWLKTKLPRTAIVAAHWAYGSQLNVLAGVKTITDQDTYLQNWIHLYYKHVIFAESEREALAFLKTHGATHLMLVGQQPAKHFLLGELSDAFLPVYPAESFDKAGVNVWEIHYPSDIHADVKYLFTGFPEIDRHLESKIK